MDKLYLSLGLGKSARSSRPRISSPCYWFEEKQDSVALANFCFISPSEQTNTRLSGTFPQSIQPICPVEMPFSDWLRSSDRYARANSLIPIGIRHTDRHGNKLTDTSAPCPAAQTHAQALAACGRPVTPCLVLSPQAFLRLPTRSFVVQTGIEPVCAFVAAATKAFLRFPLHLHIVSTPPNRLRYSPSLVTTATHACRPSSRVKANNRADAI
ncbi:unnamed protein product, partial [Protopolystoma xenopodis]